MIHLIAGAGFTRLFYVTLLVGIIFHFWAGLVGANVSTFDEDYEEKIILEEENVKYGRIAPFFRNLAQLVFVGLIMYFISRTNLMMNALHWLEKDAFKNFGKVKMELFQYGGLPLLQLLTCIWTMVLLKHATAATEFDRKGKEAKGRKNFRIFSLLIVITAGALFGLMYFASTRRAYIMPTMGTLYIAVVALAAVIEEFCMCRLPNVRGKAEDFDEPEEESFRPDDSVDFESFKSDEPNELKKQPKQDRRDNLDIGPDVGRRR